jgi:hypothetical protein
VLQDGYLDRCFRLVIVRLGGVVYRGNGASVAGMVRGHVSGAERDKTSPHDFEDFEI